MASLEAILTDLGPVVQGNNVLLFVILILLFVIGYKVLQTVMRLGLIAVMSGVFLVVLNMIGIGPDVTIQRFILFMVLGTGLFIFYSTLATAVSILDIGYSVLSRTVKWAFSSGSTKRNRGRERGWLKRLTERAKKGGNSDPASNTGSKEKTIVLDEVDEDE